MTAARTTPPGDYRAWSVASATAVAQCLDDQAVLVTVLGDDAAAASRELDDLCARARG